MNQIPLVLDSAVAGQRWPAPIVVAMDKTKPKSRLRKWSDDKAVQLKAKVTVMSNRAKVFKNTPPFTRNWFMWATAKGSVTRMYLYLITHKKRDETLLADALHVAIKEGHLDAVVFLIRDYNPPLNELGEDQFAPIHLAARNSLPPVIKWVVGHGADVNLPGPNGRTALHMASQRDKETIDSLVKRGADVHIKDNKGNTALHEAAAGKSVPIIERLLHAGSRVFETNNAGQTPLYVATVQGDPEVIQYLADFEVRLGRQGRGWNALNMHENRRLVGDYVPDDEDFLI